MFNFGYCEEVVKVMRIMLCAFIEVDVDVIVVFVGLCMMMICMFVNEFVGEFDFGKLLYELSEFFVEYGGDLCGCFDVCVVYYDFCYMLCELGFKDELCVVFVWFEGVELVEWEDECCCGFGGMFVVC